MKKKKKLKTLQQKNMTGHQLPHQMPLFSGNENLDPNHHLENLVERAKGLKKKGHKDGKRKKSWVEKKKRKEKKGRVELNDEVSQSNFYIFIFIPY